MTVCGWCEDPATAIAVVCRSCGHGNSTTPQPTPICDGCVAGLHRTGKIGEFEECLTCGTRVELRVANVIRPIEVKEI
jgi:transcription elongation factor Elf1